MTWAWIRRILKSGSVCGAIFISLNSSSLEARAVPIISCQRRETGRIWECREVEAAIIICSSSDWPARVVQQLAVKPLALDTLVSTTQFETMMWLVFCRIRWTAPPHASLKHRSCCLAVMLPGGWEGDSQRTPRPWHASQDRSRSWREEDWGLPAVQVRALLLERGFKNFYLKLKEGLVRTLLLIFID